MREINLKITDKEYLDFLSISLNDELSVEEKLKQIIRYHVIVYRNQKKLKNKSEYAYKKLYRFDYKNNLNEYLKIILKYL